ncbi:EI24 domain-containing protein [Pelomonas sp. APW6]|uniref:EI24 domain-containing protein n=1 Tax=Roseateles subflavus TaxID=3053353 RepID=A0ABT7LGX8_9BURK|nr:EI24 domain-containing protein [Pelomonas sp. APW6]MDL5032103.1 EI24 domain-containing protein [Pelomonas sp. APW6]
MISTLSRVADAFWRAAAYCLHPRVIALSLLPLLIAGPLAWGLMYFFWEPAVDGVRATLESWRLIETVLTWLDHVGLQGLRTAIAPLVLLAMAVPALLVFSLLLVAVLMTPAMTNLVAQRRFPGLERKRGAPFWLSVLWSLGHTLLAVLALLLSMPFWLIPPLALFLPPLIWGWLGYRVFGFDALAEHASRIERRRILAEHRVPLLGLGVLTGFLGAAPTAIWAFGVLSLALAPFLILASVFLYTLVFAFSSLWFAHYCLQALHELRQSRATEAPGDLLDPRPADEAAPPALEEAQEQPPALPAPSSPH